MERKDFVSSGKRLKVAIAGFGIEGRAILDYLKVRGGDMDITVLDQGPVDVPKGVEAVLGADVFDRELDYDLVWRASPSIAPSRLKTGGEVTTMTQEFFSECPAPIIGVTGTKGKGTTAALTADILKAAGKPVHLLGNIGVPALSKLPEIKAEDIVVFELSSFQLWDLKQSPHVAVVLMIEPDHLDVHSDLDDYLNAKSNIARWQQLDDAVIYDGSNPLSVRVGEVGLGKKLKLPSATTAVIKTDVLSIDGQEICPVADFGLIGQHNHLNIMAALTAAWQYEKAPKAAAKAIREFKGLPHRLQVIADKQGIKFVDDSISTTPTSAIAAIKSFDGPKVIILGGSDKGADFNPLAKELSQRNDTKALLMGETTGKIRVCLDNAGFKSYESLAGGMDTVVKRASELAGAGGSVLLSPACASFDMFKDYKDRAEQFKAAVDKL